MIGPIPYGVIPNTTHLSKRERAIWAAYMKQHAHPNAKVFYDVECGGMRGSLAGLKPEWAKNAQYLGRYKIDVVLETDAWIAVIEVKGEATTKAMGELWLYDDLLKAEWEITKPVRCIVVSDEEMPNIRAALEKEGYELVVVPVTEQTDQQGSEPLGGRDDKQDNKAEKGEPNEGK